MILKEITTSNAISAIAKAGKKQEQDVAFYLRRAFKDHPHVFVINDFKFSFNGETAQIDHLLVYPFGFILIESKSIKGEVKVNSHSEWTRSYNNKWAGMPSPIKQLELQQTLLRELLFENRSHILSKLLGIKQQSFGMRCWDNVCAVSSCAIIDRKSMPADISNQLVKSEFLVDKLTKVMNLSNSIVRALNILDTRPMFNYDDLTAITKFLMSQVVGTPQELQQIITEPLIETVNHERIVPLITEKSRMKCKRCGEPSDYTAQSGRYGYYIKCNKCSTNTAMKIPCVNCQSKNVKVSKCGDSYLLTCDDCESTEVLL